MRLANSFSSGLLTFLSSLHGRLIAGFLVSYLIAWEYARFVSARDPTSYFVDPDIAYGQKYTAHRIEQSNAYIAHTKTAGVKNAADPPYLCIGIVTVQRKGARYFKTAMGSLLDGMSTDERKEVELITYVANTDPKTHMAWNETWLRDVSDKVVTMEGAMSDDLKKHFAELEHQTGGGHVEKALWDYSHALDLCYQTGAPFSLMLEDDVIAARGWYTHARVAMKQLQGVPEFDKSLYLRLFYTEQFLGWNSEEWKTYLFWSLVVELTIAGLILWGRHSSQTLASRVLTWRTTIAILSICVPACVALYFAAGRCTVAPLPFGLQKMNNFGCCSQALMFPRDQIPGLRSFYAQERIGFRDTLAEKYADANGLERWAFKPSLFQHVGSISSKDDPHSVNPRRYGRKAADLLWNYEFEDFDVEKGAGNKANWGGFMSYLDW